MLPRLLPGAGQTRSTSCECSQPTTRSRRHLRMVHTSNNSIPPTNHVSSSPAEVMASMCVEAKILLQPVSAVGGTRAPPDGGRPTCDAAEPTAATGSVRFEVRHKRLQQVILTGCAPVPGTVPLQHAGILFVGETYPHDRDLAPFLRLAPTSWCSDRALSHRRCCCMGRARNLFAGACGCRRCDSSRARTAERRRTGGGSAVEALRSGANCVAARGVWHGV
jgi:hypothetical protein